MTCVLCDRPITDESDAMQVERSGDRAHKSCCTAYQRGHSRAHDEMLRAQLARRPYYMRSDFPGPLKAVCSVIMRWRGTRIEICADQTVLAWIDQTGVDAMRAMLDELERAPRP